MSESGRFSSRMIVIRLLSLSTFHIVNRCSLEPAYSIIRHGSVFVSTVFLIKYPFASGALRLETSSFYPCRVI